MKTITTVYVDGAILARAKIQGINISKFLEDALKIRLNLAETSDSNEPLERQIAKAEVELSESQRKLMVLSMRKTDIEDKEKSLILEVRDI